MCFEHRTAAKLAAELQPDQQPACWNDHVAVYEFVFEPLTSAFASRALDLLDLNPGGRLIDVGAGSGTAALMAASRGADVLAIDAAEQMVMRIRRRAEAVGPGRIRAGVMDGTALALAPASFDAAISVFGVILFPDAGLGMREIARVLGPGGRVAVVTWTETEQYSWRCGCSRLLHKCVGRSHFPQRSRPSCAFAMRPRYGGCSRGRDWSSTRSFECRSAGNSPRHVGLPITLHLHQVWRRWSAPLLPIAPRCSTPLLLRSSAIRERERWPCRRLPMSG